MRTPLNADALFLPGGARRPLPAFPILEEDYGKPVFTNRSTRAWRLIHASIAPTLRGWGRLLTTPRRGFGPQKWPYWSRRRSKNAALAGLASGLILVAGIFRTLVSCTVCEGVKGSGATMDRRCVVALCNS